MGKIYRAILGAMLCFALVSPSYADTSDLLKLLGDKEYWAEIKWEKFEDTKLYQAAEWRPPGWPFRSGVTVTSCYTIPIAWAALGIEKMTLYEESRDISDFRERKELSRVWATSGNKKTGEEYANLVRWGNKNFGEAVIKDQKTESVMDDRVVSKVKTSWDLGATTVSVTAEETSLRSKDQHSFIIILSFDKNTSKAEPEVKAQKE
jgi:hypothetical protein